MYCSHIDCKKAQDFISLEIKTTSLKNEDKSRMYFIDKISDREWLPKNFVYNLTNPNDGAFKVNIFECFILNFLPSKNNYTF